MNPAVPQPARLLLVEDEEAHAELVRRAFEDHGGASIAVAPNLAAAQELLNRGEDAFELVLTDLRLPDGLGISLLDGENRQIPVVIMTSQGDERAAVEAIKRGAYDYIVKSVVAFEEMPRTAERVLREWRLEQDKRALEQALRERERLAGIGTAAATLAHEIGNPLNSMALTAQLIERRLTRLAANAGVDVSDVAKLVSLCRREITRLSELLDEFRGLSRERNLKLEPLDLMTLFEGVIESQASSFEEVGVEIRVALPPEPILVMANGDKMVQVLINLCKNAVEAMERSGQIELSARHDEDKVVVTVSDTGPGLPEDFDAFAPFATTKEKGTGLGLAVVAQVLAAHGGRAWHEPAEGGGACFCLELRAAGQASGVG